MRLLAPVALLGSFFLAATAGAQSLAEHAAAAAGATIGTAAGKPLSNAITNIFGKTDAAARKAASAPVEVKAPPRTTAVEPGPALPNQAGAPTLPPIGEPAPARHGGFARRPAVAQETPDVMPEPLPVPAPPRKEPTAEEVASVQVGMSEQDLLTALGQPESRVTIPDDDGHLVEICQYWASGKQLGTVRLDNGQVISVNGRTQN